MNQSNCSTVPDFLSANGGCVCQYSFVYYKISQIFYHDHQPGACLEVDEGACYCHYV